ncbi:MAG: glycosyltransferase family 1 protein [Verrucomicrobiota bacterium JB023]|nr:glycosyltransferase family 1 protein [Verrucomicrobiota bacterium JB023]
MKTINWYGAHPEEVSISMDIYQASLAEEIREDDPYEIQGWPKGPLELGRGKRRLHRFAGKYLTYPLRVRLESGAADLVHFLDHSSGHLVPHVADGVKTVVTLHDLIPLHDFGGLTPKQLVRFRGVVENLRQADRVVSVSEFSKQEAVDLLSLNPEKIVVVPNGVKMPDQAPGQSVPVARMRENEVDRVVLSVGSTLERKNLSLLPAALKEASRVSGKRWGLLRVGAPLSETLKSAFAQCLGEGGLLEWGRASAEELSAAYHDADVVVIPSRSEGFGLPVLEAFSHGTPVACSNTSSLPEVCDGLGCLFPPDDAAEAGAKLVEAHERAEDESFREQLVARARAYSWRRSLEGLYEVYDDLLTIS